VQKRACILVLPGGRVNSDEPSHAWHPANLRMALIAGELRRGLGRAVEVRRVQYRYRGWNGPTREALRDALGVLEDTLRRFEPEDVVLVGHSMGGRVAAHLCADRRLGAVVALAPWWPKGDADLIPAATRLLVIHGSADTRTDPRNTAAQTERARDRGVDATWVGLEGAGHAMLRPYREWQRRTTDFIADYLKVGRR
jgi:pimeloyl-ACP methyl ester carboxylesterase